MKIEFTNFRCYRSSVFEFPQTGLVLLKGASGEGKSTLLNGVYYALFGGLRRPVSHGESTCLVTLTMDHVKITRTNNPATLTVVDFTTGDHLSDQLAQEFIDDFLGVNKQKFELGCYNRQATSQSFLTMTPTEQLRHLESLCVNSGTITEYKKEIHTETKTSKEQLVSKTTKKSTLEEVLQKMPTNANGAKVKKPELDLEDTEKKINSKTKKLVGYTVQLQNLRNELEESFSKRSEKIRKIQLELSVAENNYKDLKSKLLDLDSLSKLQSQQVELSFELEKTLELAEKQKIQLELEDLEDVLKDTPENVPTYVPNRKETIQEAKKLLSLEKNATNIPTLIECLSTLKKKLLRCPKCSASLEYTSSGTLKNSKECKHLDRILADLIVLQNCSLSQEELDDIHEKLKRKNYLFQRLEDFSDCDGYTFDPDDLKKQIEELKEEILLQHNYKSELSRLTRVITSTKKTLGKLSNTATREPKEISDDISSTTDKISKLSLALAHFKEIVTQHTDYKNYKTTLAQKKELTSQITDLEEEITELTSVICKLKELSDLFREAEVRSLESTLSSINIIADEYLQKLFSASEKTTVEVRSSRLLTTGDLKIQLSTYVHHKGYTSSIDALSGGELQRVELSFLLAINQMLSCRFLFLDESLNYLSTSVSNTVFEILKTESSNSLVVVVSPDIDEKIFDTVIDV